MDDQPLERLHASLLALLDEAIAIGPAQFGNIQILNRAGDALEIVVARGFAGEFLEVFRTVRAADPSACGRAWRLRRRVAIADVAHDLAFAPYLPVAERAGFRAVQCTPILGADGNLVGMLSTHFAVPRQPSLAEGILLDHCAGRAAPVVERVRAG